MRETKDHIRRIRSSTLPPCRAEAGASLFSVTIAMALFSVGALAVMGNMIQSTSLNKVSRETSVAAQAARAALERVRATAFSDAFATFNDNTGDDPGSPGSAPGPHFAVAGLDPVEGDSDGMAGEILFPVSNSQDLAENETVASLGMPRDLNGDGTVDNKKHSDDYIVLPVTVRVVWAGNGGAREFELHALLSR